MTVIEYILDGLEAELALERELGLRIVECDRSLLVSETADAAPRPARPTLSPSASAPRHADHEVPRTPAPIAAPAPVRSGAPAHPFVFVHHAPLSAAGSEMIAKITVALGATAESAPVVTAPPLPVARVYVVLGALALKRWFPGRTAGPGQWLQGDGGEMILVTYSPEFFLRYKVVTPAVDKLKHEMWNSLKEMKRRLQK